MGTPALTTRGMKERDMLRVADWIARVVEEMRGYTLPVDKEGRTEVLKKFRSEVGKNKSLLRIKKEVSTFARKFPVP